MIEDPGAIPGRMYPPPLLSGTDYLKIPALEPPTTPGAVRDLLGVGFARFQIVEIYPLMFASDPPKLSPDFVLSSARTTQRDHRHSSLLAQGRAIIILATNHNILLLLSLLSTVLRTTLSLQPIGRRHSLVPSWRLTPPD